MDTNMTKTQLQQILALAEAGANETPWAWDKDWPGDPDVERNDIEELVYQFRMLVYNMPDNPEAQPRQAWTEGMLIQIARDLELVKHALGIDRDEEGDIVRVLPGLDQIPGSPNGLDSRDF